MRVQFNLLPDVKQQYIKAQRAKKTITAIALLVSVVCAAMFVLTLSVVYGVNKLQLSGADKSIKNYQKQLSDIPNLDKILTIQNQLTNLQNLHQNKHITSRLFDYLYQLTPTTVKMGRLNLDLAESTIQLDGVAGSQKDINTFIDTLKFTTYKLNGKDTGKKAFSSVVESSFGITQQGASYNINAQFDPALFTNNDTITLNIPSGVTTRSVIDDPSNVLFNGLTGSKDQKDNSGSQ
jgi:Tfp pilus assembly protein PilN